MYVDFISGSTPLGNFNQPPSGLTEEKASFGTNHRAEWLGLL
jgi:hypothetical protein